MPGKEPMAEETPTRSQSSKRAWNSPPLQFRTMKHSFWKPESFRLRRLQECTEFRFIWSATLTMPHFLMWNISLWISWNTALTLGSFDGSSLCRKHFFLILKKGSISWSLMWTDYCVAIMLPECRATLPQDRTAGCRQMTSENLKIWIRFLRKRVEICTS